MNLILKRNYIHMYVLCTNQHVKYNLHIAESAFFNLINLMYINVHFYAYITK